MTGASGLLPPPAAPLNAPVTEVTTPVSGASGLPGRRRAPTDLAGQRLPVTRGSSTLVSGASGLLPCRPSGRRSSVPGNAVRMLVNGASGLPLSGLPLPPGFRMPVRPPSGLPLPVPPASADRRPT